MTRWQAAQRGYIERPMKAASPIYAPPNLALDVPPWRLSGVVVGVLMNDPAALAAVGAAAFAAPYKAPPQAPVLYIKPRNTLAQALAPMVLPQGCAALEVGVNLGLVMGRSAFRVPEAQALACVAAYALTIDMSVPHSSFYRPSVRLKALDGSCRIGPHRVRETWPEMGHELASDTRPFNITVHLDGVLAQQANTGQFTRQAARLIADVSSFMTLHPGDVLMLGTPAGAPWVHAGQRVRASIEGIGELEFAVEAGA